LDIPVLKMVMWKHATSPFLTQEYPIVVNKNSDFSEEINNSLMMVV
jgi:hypothetical protein